MSGKADCISDVGDKTGYVADYSAFAYDLNRILVSSNPSSHFRFKCDLNVRENPQYFIVGPGKFKADKRYRHAAWQD
jgi:hypothetical protein